MKGDNVQYGQYMSPQMNNLFVKAENYMQEYDDQYISMEHVLRAAIDVDETTKRYVDGKKRSSLKSLKR